MNTSDVLIKQSLEKKQSKIMIIPKKPNEECHDTWQGNQYQTNDILFKIDINSL